MKKLNREKVQKIYVDLLFEQISKIIPVMMISQILEDENKSRQMVYSQLWEQMDNLSNSELYDRIRKDFPELLDEYNDKNPELQSASDE